MNTRDFAVLSMPLILALFSTGCSGGKGDPQAEAPPPLKVERVEDHNVFQVDHPELFQLTQAAEHVATPQLRVTGTVNPDISRAVPVISIATGRVVEIDARLGDTVKKGQLLLKVQSADISGAFSDYRKAVADEQLAQTQLERAKLLYDKGAISLNDLQVAQDTEDKAKVDVETAEHHIQVLGADPAHLSPLINLKAPESGTIVEQNVAGFEGVKSLDNTPNLFTIANLSEVWVVCDVFENDLGEVHLGDAAEIHLNAFPDRIFKGKVADISRVLDPNTRSAKVRIVLGNADGALRPGMYAVATFRSRKLTDRIVVPATAIMRLHDKDWVFRKEGGNRFRKIAVEADGLAPDGMQQIRDGVKAGDELVTNALEFSTEVAEKKE